MKAQIHAGGRGKGGGVKVAKSLDEVKKLSAQILGMQLKTHQTGPQGQKVRRLLIEEGADIKKELYVGMVVDRGTQRVALMASSEGGMDIEEVAAKTPEKIHKVFIDPATGLTDARRTDVARKIGMPESAVGEAAELLQEALQVLLGDRRLAGRDQSADPDRHGKVVALDSKLNFDDNALFRHPDIVAMRDMDEEDPLEIEASKYDLNYISLDGKIGCMVNGAGLAMATMDTIKLFGGSPANFLDVGGGATAEKVTAAFKIMLSNPKVKAILVNIFGGIMKCDTIAAGVVAAAREVKLSVPLVVRMKGTNEDLGKKILKDSGPADHLGRQHGARRARRWSPRSRRRRSRRTRRRKTKPAKKKAKPVEKEGQGRRRRRKKRRQEEEEMSILIDKNTRVVTQGITGKTGMFHTQTSRAYAGGKHALRRRREPEEGGRELRGHPDLSAR